jgi:c-di-GMP-binding flagellar brake protein YcgR
MERPEDRRSYVRIPMCAYSCGKFCSVEVNGGRISASLVDISAGGARLRLSAPLPDPPLLALTVSVDDVPDNGLLKDLRAQIRWRCGQEIGVKFERALGIGLSDLQRLVC